MKNSTQDKQRAKQQKSNIDKLDSVLANLPEAQYAHGEEAPKAPKRRGRPPKAENKAKAEKAPAKKGGENRRPGAEKARRTEKENPGKARRPEAQKGPGALQQFLEQKEKGSPLRGGDGGAP